MDAPFVGTQVVGPDLAGEPTGWAVLSSHPFVVGHDEGGPRFGGWVVWLIAPDHPMLCVGDQGFAPEGPYCVLSPEP